MRPGKFAQPASALLASVLVLACANFATAESLAGKVGHKRYPVRFPVGTTGDCAQGYKDYVAASGHSAYAQTPLDYSVNGFFCGIQINAPTKEAAEERALTNCKATGKKYKYSTTGRCEIYVSK